MSSPTIETLRDQLKERVATFGYSAVARAAGVEVDTLRLFVTMDGRGLHARTQAKLERYLSPVSVPAPDAFADDIRRALNEARATVATLEAIEASMTEAARRHPDTGELKRSAKAALHPARSPAPPPHPNIGSAGRRTGSPRGDTSPA